MSDAELQAERHALHIEHREIRAEHERLHVPPFDRAAHLATPIACAAMSRVSAHTLKNCRT
jgi:hypothetical protein